MALVYKSFSARNFRGLDDVTLPDLRRINILSGKNDVGKTSILEAIFLHTSGPQAGTNAVRALSPVRGQPAVMASHEGMENPWRPFFRNLDGESPIELGAETRNGRRTLSLSIPERTAYQDMKLGTADESLSRPERLLIHEKVGDGTGSTRVQSAFVEGGADVSGGAVSIKFELEPASRDAWFNAYFVTGRGTDLAEAYSSMRREGYAVNLLEAVQGIDRRVESIEVLVTHGRPALYVTLDDGLILPMALLGDGCTAIAGYVLTLTRAKQGVLLIDEIETGIHWSALPHLWASVHRLAQRFNVQVFCTTHSHEAVVAAVQALGADSQDLALLRTARDERTGHVRVANYDSSEISAGVEMGVDLR
jgi:hypothetical protein